eukprot:13046838-Alexandrium_andersonii.AAC.1
MAQPQPPGPWAWDPCWPAGPARARAPAEHAGVARATEWSWRPRAARRGPQGARDWCPCPWCGSCVPAPRAPL